MMNVKVIEIVSRLENGHARTVYAVVPLTTTALDLCNERKIPLLSVILVKETTPMSLPDAVRHSFHKQTALMMNSNVVSIQVSLSIDDVA